MKYSFIVTVVAWSLHTAAADRGWRAGEGAVLPPHGGGVAVGGEGGGRW